MKYPSLYYIVYSLQQNEVCTGAQGKSWREELSRYHGRMSHDDLPPHGLLSLHYLPSGGTTLVIGSLTSIINEEIPWAI